jgi:GTP-binding protein
MTVIVHKARFVKGVTGSGRYPDWNLPEIAFAGRSNVGKSSALQVLLQGRCKVRISKTPGRTRELNFFQTHLEVNAIDQHLPTPLHPLPPQTADAPDAENTAHTTLAMVDLPGYGYAKVPLWKRSDWGPLVEAYLENRSNLCGVVLLCDLRRGPEAEEHGLVEYLAAVGLPICLVLTKSDKLSKNRRKPAAYEARKKLSSAAPTATATASRATRPVTPAITDPVTPPPNGPPIRGTPILFSAKTKTGATALWRWILKHAFGLR